MTKEISNFSSPCFPKKITSGHGHPKYSLQLTIYLLRTNKTRLPLQKFTNQICLSNKKQIGPCVLLVPISSQTSPKKQKEYLIKIKYLQLNPPTNSTYTFQLNHKSITTKKNIFCFPIFVRDLGLNRERNKGFC